MTYKIISCDDHLDLNQLPHDLWLTRLPAELRDRAPHIEERDGRGVWICEGKVWGSWSGRLAGKNWQRAKGPNPNAFDRGGITDQSELRPGVAALRLADMDRDGVYAHVMYGPATSIELEDATLRDACYRAYNDWLAEFCAAAPHRLIGVPMLPGVPDAATAELRRLATLGIFKQANLQIANVKPRLDDPAWEPFWDALEETGIILSFHVVVFLGPSKGRENGKPASAFTSTKAFIEQFLDPFVDLFAWGILERHPRIKLVMAESGTGWLPWVVQELDHRYDRLFEAKEYWDSRGGIELKLKPSEIFRRQVFVTFQDDHVALALLPFYGENNLLWASDYPHPDSTWPNSQQVIERQMAKLPEPLRKKILHDNAARLYGLAA